MNDNLNEKSKLLEKKLMKRRARRDKNLRSLDVPVLVSLGPLLDIVTIILVYFIFTFAISPISVQDPAVDLPVSNSEEKIENAVVVMVTGPTRQDPTNNDMIVITKNVPSIIVDNKALLQLDPETYRIPDNYKEKGYVIWPLKKVLMEEREKQIETAELTGEAEASGKSGFNGVVAIVADKATPYRVLTDILVTCGEAGYGNFKFTIAKREKN